MLLAVLYIMLGLTLTLCRLVGCGVKRNISTLN